MQAPAQIPTFNIEHHQQLSFNDQKLLDYYHQSLLTALHQVEELKRITRSRKVMGACVICSSPSNSSTPLLSTRRSNDVFKKSGSGRSHSQRRSSRMSSIQMGDMKEGPSTSDGLILAVDKFLTAGYRG